MRFFLISDNSDAMNGLRLAGIEGTVARSEADLRQALENAANQPDIAVLLVTEEDRRDLHRGAGQRPCQRYAAAYHCAFHRRRCCR